MDPHGLPARVLRATHRPAETEYAGDSFTFSGDPCAYTLRLFGQ